jgi:hypothetical protein
MGALRTDPTKQRRALIAELRVCGVVDAALRAAHRFTPFQVPKAEYRDWARLLVDAASGPRPGSSSFAAAEVCCHPKSGGLASSLQTFGRLIRPGFPITYSCATADTPLFQDYISEFFDLDQGDSLVFQIATSLL